MTEPALSLTDVAFGWPGKGGFKLRCPSFEMAQGESVLLLGESGSGKSTLLSLICGTILAESGQVTVAGTDLAEISNGARDRFRVEQIGMIFQQFNLLPFGSVMDNIMLPLRFAPKRRKRVGNARSAAEELCSALGLSDDLILSKAGALSVGQQQRVAVARALIGRPPIVIADEPTSALDATSQDAFLDILFEQVRGFGTTLLMVSHDPRLARHFDRVLHIDDIATVERLSQ